MEGILSVLIFVGLMLAIIVAIVGVPPRCCHCKKRQLTSEGMPNGDAELFGLPVRVRCLNCGKESTI